jgi:hypothetical protein
VVPAVGDPDLIPDGEISATRVADPIRAGDGDAIAGFRATRLPRVQAYVTQVCPPDLADEAVSAAFVDFFARIAAAPIADAELDGLLLSATRSAAAGRFTVASPPGRTLAVSAECHAMPELLAAHANRERPSDEGLIAGHLGSCSICAHTLVRMQDAERAFAKPSGELAALVVQETVVDTTRTPPRRPTPPPPPSPPPTPPPPAHPSAEGRGSRESKPKLEPESSLPEAPSESPARRSGSPGVAAHAPAAGRRRSGGLVGAVRRFGRNIRS